MGLTQDGNGAVQADRADLASGEEEEEEERGDVQGWPEYWCCVIGWFVERADSRALIFPD